MLPVPEASLPASEICSERFPAATTTSATETLQSGMNTTLIRPATSGSALTTAATELISLMMRLACW